MLSGIKYKQKDSRSSAPVQTPISSDSVSPTKKSSLNIERIAQDSSLKELIQNEHLTSSSDYSKHFASTISRETEDDYELPPEQHRAERIDRHKRTQPVSRKTMT
jgi:hypothetical protein